MSGINAGTRVLYSLKFKLSLACYIFIMLAPTNSFGTVTKSKMSPFADESTKSHSLVPYFDEITKRQIDAIEGQTVIIPCTVRSLTREKVVYLGGTVISCATTRSACGISSPSCITWAGLSPVSWIRTKDLHILTSGLYAYSSDYRFEPVHTDSSEDFWGLRIRGVKPYDTGQYECQVNTEPKLSLALKLTVSNFGQDATSKWMGYAKIKEPKEVFVQHGSSFFVGCEITLTMKQNINYDVWWLHEDIQISYQLKESRISIQTTFNKDKNTLHSILTFDYITWQDGGTYTCLQPSIKQDSVKIVVVEAESSEAMQRDYPISSRSTKKINAFYQINIFLILSANLLIIVCY